MDTRMTPRDPKGDKSYAISSPPDASGRFQVQMISCPVDEEGWAEEKSTHIFSQPYTFRECVAWIWNNLFGPSQKNANLTEWLSSGTTLNQISPVIRLTFIGDIMPCSGRELAIHDDIRQFVSDSDFLIGNFEGTILTTTARPVFMGQRHDPSVLHTLRTLFPAERTVLACSNNHSGDYGWTRYQRSCSILADHGFAVIGRRDTPTILLNHCVSITAGSWWSNQRCTFISSFSDCERNPLPDAAFRIFYPCWGYELQVYPNPAQIATAEQLLKRWNMIVGFHSHCPQPLCGYGTDDLRMLVAYSLGNFAFGRNLRKYLSGIVLKVEIGTSHSGKWAAGRVDWRFTKITFPTRRRAEVGIASESS
jgi:hypothetical protein